MVKKPPTLKPISISIDEHGAYEAAAGSVVHTNKFRMYGREALFRLKKLAGNFTLKELSEIKDCLEDEFEVEAKLEDEKEPGE
jgi:Ran GTPase-activating protein (RanGAP) involved in mRNA processing and transport